MSEIQVLEARQHFPSLTVYERQGASGRPVVRIGFKHLEFSRAHALLWGLPAFFLIVGTVPGFFFFAVAASENGWTVPLIVAGVWIVAALWTYDKANAPALVARSVELDFGADRIRVLNDAGRVAVERRLSALNNLTVDAHPDAEAARHERAQKGQKKLSEAERQHVLIGWFGAGGAERVTLLARAEWPDRRSLFEVRQAIMWAIQRAAGPGARDLMSEPQPARAGGLNPPLD